MTARTHLLAIQRDLCERLEREIEDELVRERPAIRRYDDEYRREFMGGFATSSREELVRAAAAADIVYVGDYHTLEAAQRAFVWLAESVAARRGVLAIALEMLEPSDQPAVDAYLDGRIDETSFLARTRYASRWGFSWEHYKPILDFARRTGSSVHGIDSPPHARRATLDRRDRFAANVIAGLAAARPGRALLVLAGDFHLAGSHLPDRVDARLAALGEKRTRAIVFQNSELIYWKLARLKREQATEVVRLDASRFCLMGSTPVAKVGSYADWARSTGEPDLVVLRSLGAAGDGSDADGADEVLAIVADFFGVDVPRDAGSRAAVDAGARDDLLGSIGTGHSPLARTFLDRMAERAARRIRAGLLGARPRDAKGPETPAGAFYRLAIDEAIAFLGSLVVNHARSPRCDDDFRAFASRRPRRGETGASPARLAARLYLRHRAAEERWLSAGARGRAPSLSSLYAADPGVRDAVARALGERLGSLLHRGLVGGRYPRARLRALLFAPFDEPGEARACYLGLLADLARGGARVARAGLVEARPLSASA